MLPEVLRFLGDYYQITYCILVLLSALFLPNGLISIYGKAVRLFKKKTAVKGGEGCE
jgi:branched-chain amino acid transport system permease protein